MKDEAKDRYLLRKYGRGLEWYNWKFREQGGVCAMCGKPPGKTALAVDHDHAYKYVRIAYTKVGQRWRGKAVYLGMDFEDEAALKRNVTRSIRAALKYFSVRGLIDWPCNRTLRSANNSVKVLRNGAAYLERFYHPGAVNTAVRWCGGSF